MAREFESERQYVKKFQDIIANTLSFAYAIKDCDETYQPEKIQELRGCFKKDAGELVKQMEKEEPPVDRKISRLISACYREWASIDLEVKSERERFCRQMNLANYHYNFRLKKLRANSFPKHLVFF